MQKGYLELDDNAIPINGFSPDPAKTVNQTIAAAGNFTLDTTEDLAIQIISDKNLTISFDGGTTVYPVGSGVLFNCLTVKIDSILFTSLEAVDATSVYALRQ